MELKGHSHSKILLSAVVIILSVSCTSKKNTKKEVPIMAASFFVDTTAIPLNTVLSTDKKLVLDNGIFYYNNLLFSGHIKGFYSTDTLMLVNSYLNGMQHGRSVCFYPDGKLHDSRMYKENKSFGKHYGYWENGNMKFEYYYFNDKREGSNKQWYHSGQPYAFLSFKDDKEDGMQHAWRENGKPYINYEAKGGYRYGLQKSNLCYTLEKEKFK